jgi:hypothetical protein
MHEQTPNVKNKNMFFGGLLSDKGPPTLFVTVPQFDQKEIFSMID